MEGIQREDLEDMLPRDVSEVPTWMLASLGGVVYVLLVQLVVMFSGFTTEVLWLWPLALADAWARGNVTSMLGSGEWWLAFAYPVSVASLGFVATYSYFRSRGVLAAAVAALYIVLFAMSEIVLGLEIGVLFVLLAPVTALAALGVHVAEARYFEDGLVDIIVEQLTG